MIFSIYYAMIVFHFWNCLVDFAWWVSPVCVTLLLVCEAVSHHAFGKLEKRVAELERQVKEKDGADNA